MSDLHCWETDLNLAMLLKGNLAMICTVTDSGNDLLLLCVAIGVRVPLAILTVELYFHLGFSLFMSRVTGYNQS